MNWLLKSATIVTPDPPLLETTDLRIDGARVVERGPNLEPRPGEESIDLSAKLVMPGMVCAHTHLYSALARGMPAPPLNPTNFREILELIWWRLDRALDEETIYYSALAGAADAARAGTTCLFDHHSSPSHISGSLQIVREAIEEVGLRAVLCYEVTDRGGFDDRDRGLEENDAFLRWTREASSGGAESHHLGASHGRASSLFRGMVGAHASFTLSDESVRLCAELMRRHEAGLHIHAAEDLCDVQDAREKYDSGVVERLAGLGAINRRTILAHGVHLSKRDIQIARESTSWFAHNPRSNMNNQVGYPPIASFGPHVLLGTDGIGSDMFDEMRFAFFGGRGFGGGLPADQLLSMLGNNLRLASELFGVELNTLQPGASADLIVLDYSSPTPLTAENLASHVVFGMSSANVESTMTAGHFVIRDRQPSFDATAIRTGAEKAAQKLWNKLQSS